MPAHDVRAAVIQGPEEPAPAILLRVEACRVRAPQGIRYVRANRAAVARGAPGRARPGRARSPFSRIRSLRAALRRSTPSSGHAWRRAVASRCFCPEPERRRPSSGPRSRRRRSASAGMHDPSPGSSVRALQELPPVVPVPPSFEELACRLQSHRHLGQLRPCPGQFAPLSANVGETRTPRTIRVGRKQKANDVSSPRENGRERKGPSPRGG